MTKFQDPLVPLMEAAKALGIAPGTAYKRAERTGHLHPLLPVIRFDEEPYSRVFVKRDELDALLEGRLTA